MIETFEQKPTDWPGFGPFHALLWYSDDISVDLWAWRKQNWVDAVAWDAWELSIEPDKWPPHNPKRHGLYTLWVPAPHDIRKVTARTRPK